MREVLDLVSGGIAALNHRLKAGIPSACGSNTRNQKAQVFFCIAPSHLLPALKEVSSFRVNLLLVLISVKFRVNPWQILLLILPSVAHASGSERSVFLPC